MQDFSDDQLVRSIRAHIINHPNDNAYDVFCMLRDAGREVPLLEVRDAWTRARLRKA